MRMVFNFCMRNAEVLNRDGIDATPNPWRKIKKKKRI